MTSAGTWPPRRAASWRWRTGSRSTGTRRSDIPEGRWAAQFRADAAALLAHWESQPDDQAGGADFTTAELAVHAWDLAQAVDPGRALDPVVAERALAAMRQGLTPENRGRGLRAGGGGRRRRVGPGPAGCLGGPRPALRGVLGNVMEKRSFGHQFP